MNRSEILEKILSVKIVSILRLRDHNKVMPTAEAILKGGIRAVELSLNTPNALEMLGKLKSLEGIIVGVGTVKNEEEAIASIKAGAELISLKSKDI